MLSIDAGRLAPMVYSPQPHSQPPNIMIGNGFANRGKADSIRKISIPSLPTISTSLYDDESNLSLSAIRTTRASGRAQLLAGLRTAPKTPTGIGHPDVESAGLEDPQYDTTQARPTISNSSLSKNQRMFGSGNLRNASSYSSVQMNTARPSPPQYAQEPFRGFQVGNYSGLPTPPTSSAYMSQGEPDYEAKVYADLLARNISLAQQQQILQQQMRIAQQAHQLQQAQQQMHQLHIQSAAAQVLGTPPISPAVYSPTISGHHPTQGLYSIYASQQYPSNHVLLQNQMASGPSTTHTPQVSASSSPPTAKSPVRTPVPRSSPSPPQEFGTTNRVPAEKTPTPSPSSTGTFRRGHKKCISLSGCANTNTAFSDGGPKTSIPRLSNVPSTPVNSTFGGRGDHPIRQPRGPPALEEIIAKPSAKHEGSKNFSSRQRRRALTKLVNAGIERRGTRPPVSSAGGMASVSEHDDTLCFQDLDDNMYSFHRDDCAPLSRVGGALATKRSGLSAPQLAIHSAEKRRSALF